MSEGELSCWLMMGLVSLVVIILPCYTSATNDSKKKTVIDEMEVSAENEVEWHMHKLVDKYLSTLSQDIAAKKRQKLAVAENSGKE
ncbi:unnamed protein product, partial [Mesorhabditis spiculigera]